MPSSSDLTELVKTYEKFGWRLRRLKLDDDLIAQPRDVAADVRTELSNINAAWFSRPSDAELAAWELRNIGGSPFALLEHLNESDPGFEAELEAVERRMAEAIANKRAA